jgi:hypothetical protein
MPAAEVIFQVWEGRPAFPPALCFSAVRYGWALVPVHPCGGAIACNMPDKRLSQGCFDQRFLDPGRQLLLRKLLKAS